MTIRVAMLLSNSFRPDPRVLKEADSMAACGHKVSIICWDRAAEMAAQETLASGVQVIRIQNVLSGYGLGARQMLRLPRFWLATLPILDELHPDLVHCHDFDTLPAGLFWGKLNRRPVIYDAHEHFADLCKPRLPRIGGGLLHRLIHAADLFCAWLASAIVTVDETLAAVYRKVNRQIVIIGHYPSRVLAASAKPPSKSGTLTMIYVGRLSVDRGLMVYAEMLRELRQQGIPALLRLVGAFTSQTEERLLRERCNDMDDALDIVGWRPYNEVPKLLRDADVGLVMLQPEPYYQVAVPVKLFEYMAAGLPVVASDFPPIASILNEAHCGVLVDPADAKSASAQIRHWWQHPGEAYKAGERGRQAILQKFNWETLATKLDELYHLLI
jgi:glycosyltransferase involved in cell wall biosynthesis